MSNDVTSPAKPSPSIADTPAKRLSWWAQLEPQWRSAFQFAFFGHLNPPTSEELETLWQAPVLRFTGPNAPYPNLGSELTNCSGLTGMSNLETLVLTNHRIETISQVADMPNLKSLFVNNNAIRSLAGIEGLNQLEQLYAQVNQINSLEPLRKLTHLREVYANVNALTTLDGLTRKHAPSLKAFFILPNERLPDRAIIGTERQLGIRCRSL